MTTEYWILVEANVVQPHWLWHRHFAVLYALHVYTLSKMCDALDCGDVQKETTFEWKTDRIICAVFLHFTSSCFQ